MLVLVGTNHRSAPVAVRERMAIPEEQLGQALGSLRGEPGIAEGLILSTCNRVEVLVRLNAEVKTGLSATKRFLMRQCGVSAEDLERYTYSHQGRLAVNHLFLVASGLDSMILGEPQILGQVKRAYQLAREHGSAGPVLDRLMQRCLATAKRVRTETGVSRNSVSIAYAAVKLAGNIFGDLASRTALVFGSGEMAELVAKHLQKSGVSGIVVASRTYDRAVRTAEACAGRAVHWDEGRSLLSEVDIVVSCTGSPRPILTREDVALARRTGRRGPLFIIDIAVPRDVEPAVNTLAGVYVYDIDALQDVVESNQEERRRAAADAERIIGVEVDLFDHWHREQDIAPVIVALRKRLLGLGQAEVQRFRAKLGPLTENQGQTVEAIVRAVIQKVLHRPTQLLRESVDRGDSLEVVSMLQEVFGFTEVPRGERGADAPGAPAATASTGDDPARGPQRLLRGGKREE